MFKWLKKLLGVKQEDVHQESVTFTESIFPPAEEMLEKTSAAWPIVSREEILRKIEREVKEGDREACFFNSRIDDETRDELIRQHYKVKSTSIGTSPGFIVSW